MRQKYTDPFSDVSSLYQKILNIRRELTNYKKPFPVNYSSDSLQLGNLQGIRNSVEPTFGELARLCMLTALG